jgi:hypothetical protein
MNEQNELWIEQGGERKIFVVGGGLCYVNIDSVVGYCHSIYHEGYVTKNVLKKHNCINKGCSGFEKFVSFPFWKRTRRRDENKAVRKQEIENVKNEKKTKLNDYKQAAIMLTEKYNFPITIISVRERSAKKNEVYVFYVSDSKKDDTKLYKGISVDLRWKYPKVRFWIRRIKKPDGTCATIADLPNEIKNS